MRKPAPEIHVGRFLLGGALLLGMSCGLVLLTVVYSAAARGPIVVQSAGVGAVLPTHVVEVEALPGGLKVTATNESLREFSARLADLSAAGGTEPAAVLRVRKAASLGSVRESIQRLKEAGFQQVYIALEEED